MASIGEFDAGGVYTPTPLTLTYRFLAWCVVATLFTFLLNVYLSFWRGWPGAGAIFGRRFRRSGLGTGADLTSAAIAGPAAFVARTRQRSLRQDNAVMTAIATYIVNAAFWIVLLVGSRRCGRVLPAGGGPAPRVVRSTRWQRNSAATIFGRPIRPRTADCRVADSRGHRPRTMGFAWLALLVVVAELQIVISRFIFSYEQAFMG